MLRWGVARAPKQPADPTGDGYLIRRIGETIVFAVADGAGSGPRAAETAGACLRAVRSSRIEPLSGCFEAGHRALIGSCGAALGICAVSLGRGMLSWAGVGDIDGVLVKVDGSRKAMIQRGGTLGHRMPRTDPQTCLVDDGDTLFMASDGISRGYRCALPGDASMEETVRKLLDDFGRPADDRLVLAVAFGQGP